MKPWTEKYARRRGSLSIMAEILEMTKDEAVKTSIMRKTNLSFRQVSHYLKFMLRIKLLESICMNRKVYKVTKIPVSFSDIMKWLIF